MEVTMQANDDNSKENSSSAKYAHFYGKSETLQL